MGLISVIIPVYNVKRYLHECVDSVLRQSYNSLEIILVDDGSDDGSDKICDAYALKDNRIKVIHQLNKGLSAARNAALDIASGDYITFVDSDDLISDCYIEFLHKIISQHNVDIACVDFSSDKNKLCNSADNIVPQIFSSQQTLLQMLYQKGITSSAWGKLFRKNLFDNVRFAEGLLYEDLEITPRIFENVKNVAWCKVPLYFYRRTPGSILNVFSLKRLDVLDIVDGIYAKFKGTDLESAARDRRFSAHFNMLCLIYQNNTHAPDTVARCFDIITKSRRYELADSQVRLKNKVGALASYLGLWFIKFLAKTIMR